MTGAGATYPYGKDPHDSNIRIAPSFPTLEDLKLAAEIFCVCVKLELFMEEKDMNQKKKPDDPAEQETGMRKSGLAREGIAYLIFGVLTTVIDYVISNLLYYIWKMDPVPAQTIAWVAAVLFAFVTNKWWVFESHTLNPGKVWREFVSFVLCRVATFLFNLAALFVMVDLMKMEFFLCKLLISVVVVILNYVFSKILIFTNDKKK